MCFRDYSDNFERAQRIEIFLCVFFEAVSDIYNRIITIEDKYVDLCANRTNLVTERHRKFIEAQSVSVKKSLVLNEFIDLTDNEVQTFDEEVGRLDIEFQDLKVWFYHLTLPTVIQGDSAVFSIKQNLNSLHQGEHRLCRKFQVVLSSGSHETGSTAKKVTASDSAKPGPHIHIFFESGVTGSCRNGDK